MLVGNPPPPFTNKRRRRLIREQYIINPISSRRRLSRNVIVNKEGVRTRVSNSPIKVDWRHAQPSIKSATLPRFFTLVLTYSMCLYDIYTKMNQQTWDVHADEVSLADYQKLVPLVEAIYINALAVEVNRLCIKHCGGCDISHPSQREHDCMMMLEEVKWEVYCDVAVDIVNNEGMILDYLLKH